MPPPFWNLPLELPSLGEHAAEILPDLDLLAEQLQTGSGGPQAPDAGLRAAAGGSPLEQSRDRRELLGFARRAVEALRLCRGMEVRLMPDEEVGVQVLLAATSRPAIPVQGGRLGDSPPVWGDLTRIWRAQIEAALGSVGRIEITGHPTLSWAGTAWVAAPELLLTSRRVAERFAAPAGGGGSEAHWRMRSGMSAQIDFNREIGLPPGEGEIFDVPSDAEILVHPEQDLALVPVAARSRDDASPLPPPLPISSHGGEIGMGRKVFVAGHPELDASVPVPDLFLQDRQFREIFGTKHLQPGQVLGIPAGEKSFLHDCSTLGGTSGAPVVDFEKGCVAGLHVGSVHRSAGLAVALWELRDDPMLHTAGLDFR